MYNKELRLKERGRLNRTLNQFREMLPGSFIERKITCGKPTCACMLKGELHTAFQLTYRSKGKTKTKMIPADKAEIVRERVLLKKKFQEVGERIQEINLELLISELQTKD